MSPPKNYQNSLKRALQRSYHFAVASYHFELALTKLRQLLSYRDLGIYIDSDVSNLDEVIRYADRLYTCFAVLRQLRSVRRSVPIRSPVAGDVTRSDAAGSRKCHSRRHSDVPAEAASVGDEFCIALPLCDS